MTLKIRIAVMAAALVAGLAGPAAAGSPLEDFVAGIDEGCAVNPSLKAYVSSLYKRFGEKQAVAIALPPAMKAVSGEVQLLKSGASVFETMLPTTSTFRGLKVKGVYVYSGIENGVFGYYLSFDESIDTVKKALGGRVKKSQSMMDGAFSAENTGFSTKKGLVSLYCDLST